MNSTKFGAVCFVCYLIIGAVVGFHLGWTWGLASVAAIWLLAPINQ